MADTKTDSFRCACVRVWYFPEYVYENWHRLYRLICDCARLHRVGGVCEIADQTSVAVEAAHAVTGASRARSRGRPGCGRHSPRSPPPPPHVRPAVSGRRDNQGSRKNTGRVFVDMRPGHTESIRPRPFPPGQFP
jgi:hypothetical protein